MSQEVRITVQGLITADTVVVENAKTLVLCDGVHIDANRIVGPENIILIGDSSIKVMSREGIRFSFSDPDHPSCWTSRGAVRFTHSPNDYDDIVVIVGSLMQCIEN